MYARVDYLDYQLALRNDMSLAESATWQAVLKDLPVQFTFAPMNLLHYHVAFPAHRQRVVRVSYRQFAYQDTAAPPSYQLAYVVHPASFWQKFGPIELTVEVPSGVKPVASGLSLALRPPPASLPAGHAALVPSDSWGGILTRKTGELFLGLNAKEWQEAPPFKAAPVGQGTALQRP